jgi:hypothetical protein
VEGVAEGRVANVPGLEVDCAAEEGGDVVLVLGGLGRGEDGLVRLELVGAVAEPHGIDIAGRDEGQLYIMLAYLRKTN